MKQLLSQVRQQNPEIAELSDEILVSMVMEAMQRQTEDSPDEQNLEKMSVLELIQMGQRLMDTSRWDEVEKCYFTALEKSEKADDSEGKCVCLIGLARLCRFRGDFSQAKPLFLQALSIAELVEDLRLIGIIYDEIGGICRSQGSYP